MSLEALRSAIAELSHEERIVLARWLVDSLPEFVGAVDERRPTLVDLLPVRPPATAARPAHEAGTPAV